jgi:glycosyltransferase involved in cell wall biosynthesis
VIAGVVHDEDYFRSAVEPHLDGDAVSYVGSVGPAERSRLLGGAVALLHLIEFEEPFGLSVAEAFMAGTPVIAHPRGSMPELVRHGVNGFLVADRMSAVAAVAAASTVDRSACRADAVLRFSSDRMVENYESLFEVLAGVEN